MEIGKVEFLNVPKVITKHTWEKTWKTLWLVETVKPNYKLAEDMFVTLSLTDGTEKLIRVKEGYECDLASIPSLLWSKWLPDSIELEAILHDILYQTEVFSREECDAVLEAAMVARDKPAAVTKMFGTAVRTFGWLVWREHTAESIEASMEYLEVT